MKRLKFHLYQCYVAKFWNTCRIDSSSSSSGCGCGGSGDGGGGTCI